MLWSALPSMKRVRKASRRETELWYTTTADARCLHENNIPGPGSAPATIRVNTLQAMYGQDASNPQFYPTASGLKSNRRTPS